MSNVASLRFVKTEESNTFKRLHSTKRNKHCASVEITFKIILEQV